MLLVGAISHNSDCFVSAGDSESKQALDAFFLGKAFADTVNERLGSAIGEFLSEVGRKQAEQQKEVRKCQEEVQERARIAKLKASHQALSEEDEETTKKSHLHSPEMVARFFLLNSHLLHLSSIKSDVTLQMICLQLYIAIKSFGNSWNRIFSLPFIWQSCDYVFLLMRNQGWYMQCLISQWL
ncbi:hypothetical protein O6H91_01G145200 [Diphasiastrum complanatum]|uniref:Uncharacterized protein n=1 Tax=Diphasiastrum complanatum TaxID=34168 RepID=A0ACC2EXE8_DIPCM|nr:hypothetical protein O6H91_01G145200 [Diphasiastrum complanatum]